MDAYVGEIRMFGCNYVVEGWLPCWGGTYQIGQYQMLFAVITTIYGGNGTTDFKVPDLTERSVLYYGAAPGMVPIDIGYAAGENEASLSVDQMPSHSHSFPVYGGEATQVETGHLAQAKVTGGGLKTHRPMYAEDQSEQTPLTPMHLGIVSQTGHSPAQMHENRQPFLAVNFLINFDGNFPTRN